MLWPSRKKMTAKKTTRSSSNKRRNQLRVLAIRLLLPHSLRADLGRIPNPQLKLQLSQQPFKPASVPTRFHPYSYFEFLRGQISIELFRVLTMLQSPFLQLTRVRIDKRNLLEARMVIRSYNDHRSAPFSRALVGSHHQSLLGRRSRHCYGINYTHNPGARLTSAALRSRPGP